MRECDDVLIIGIDIKYARDVAERSVCVSFVEISSAPQEDEQCARAACHYTFCNICTFSD